MVRKYETLNLSDYEFKKNIKKARENMRKKKMFLSTLLKQVMQMRALLWHILK